MAIVFPFFVVMYCFEVLFSFVTSHWRAQFAAGFYTEDERFAEYSDNGTARAIHVNCF